MIVQQGDVRPLSAFAAWLVLAAAIFTCPPPARAAEQPAGSPVVAGADGWMYLESELRFLKFPVFWGPGAKDSARTPKPDTADPVPAIVDFNNQLAAKGITLFLAPVPPKAWNSSVAPKPVPEGREKDGLGHFYARLSKEGVRCIDLRQALGAEGDAAGLKFCKTDSHWSGEGCVAAAKAVAEFIRPLLPKTGATRFQERWEESEIRGDLADLARSPEALREKVRVRRVSDASGGPLRADPSSPVLILGDSHTLVFHDFFAEGSGFTDQLAFETGFAPDWIGTRGSGSNAVRLSLLRRNAKDAGYLAGKKVVVWCFAAREFTEADQGWLQIPLSPAAKEPK